jgi:preprotein translocase subunit SecE
MMVIDGTNGEQVSRRIANLPYILWVVTFNFGFILIFTLVDIGISRSSTVVTVPKLFESININGLVVFLVVSSFYVFIWPKNVGACSNLTFTFFNRPTF